jgi:hypothetical protein
MLVTWKECHLIFRNIKVLSKKARFTVSFEMRFNDAVKPRTQKSFDWELYEL